MAERNHKVKANGRTRRKNAVADPLAVVGIGLCSTSLRSAGQLFAGLGADLGVAYVVAVRQQDGITVDSVARAIAAQTTMRVNVAADGDRLEPDRIYIGGPDDQIEITDGHLRSRKAAEPVGHRGTVDTMLISLAEHGRDRSVAVILSGLGSDGTAGVIATKQFGGLSIAESMDGEAEAMAHGGEGPAGVVDLLLPIEQIAQQILLYIRNLAPPGTSDEEEQASRAEEPLAQIATILRSATGNDFHGYKRNTFLRRVQRRMQVVQIDEIENYVARLRGDRDEVQHLFQDLLIGVTQFFRDPDEFESLAAELPALLDGKGSDDQVRVWVVGCATGEEAYSIAILLREHYAGREMAMPQAQIFATDLDAQALGIARAGRYSAAIASHISPERLGRWFVREGNTYCVTKELREMCIFSPHNLIKDAPFSRIDLLSCRNLLIYLGADLQNKVIPIFHFSLRTGGLLFLGSSENITRHQRLFAAVDRKKRLFRRLETATRVLPDFPLTGAGRRAAAMPANPAPIRSGALSAAIGRRAEQVAERYAPAYVVIDGQYDILHFSGRTGRYLEPSAGAASLNLLNLVHRDLRLDLRTALATAAESGERVEVPRVPMGARNAASLVNVLIEPIGPPTALTAMVVLFQEAGELETAAGGERGHASDEHVQRLDTELRITKERLQATIEELESTNEELKSSNEEYQSINEELQSANEELETSKEELQSVNEELQTVNAELAHRVGELARTNSDLKNLLESTQIATLFLDNDLKVRSFTPAATDVFHLLETDVGRPVGHVAIRVDYPDLEQDVRRVLKTLNSTERAVAAKEDARNYVARILPYRSVDNFIAGAVITFLDVTGTVRAESALRQSEERFRRIVESARNYAILMIDENRLVTDWFAGAEAVFGWSRDEMMGKSADITFVPEDRAAGAPEKEVETASREGAAPDIRWHQRKDGHRVFIEGTMTALLNEDGTIRGYLKIGQDVTERKRGEEHQRMLLAELQHRVRNTLGVIRSVVRRTAESSDTVDDMASHLQGRLDAFARVQAMATRKPDAGIDLMAMVEDELLAHATREGERLAIKGPEIMLRAKPAETMSLAIHELATNAVKYGALATDKGNIGISWRLIPQDGSGKLDLVWEESGLGEALEPPHREGFGLELLQRTVPYELRADTRVDFRPEGLRFTLSMPLEGNTHT